MTEIQNRLHTETDIGMIPERNTQSVIWIDWRCVWELEYFRMYYYGKKVHLYTDHQTLDSLVKRNRRNKQYSIELKKNKLERLIYFDISIQQISGSNLIYTDYFSRNSVGRAMLGKLKNT